MTRDESLAFIEALDRYLTARHLDINGAEKGFAPASTKAVRDAAREKLVDTMYPIVTGFAR